MDKTKVIVYGLGAMGASIARLILKNESLQLIGVVDNDKEKLGKDVGELLEIGSLGIPVSDSSVLSKNADIVLHSTSSKLSDIKDQIIQIIKSGSNVISTCEELAFPINENEGVAEEINAIAKSNNVVVIGSGVNPGFVLDSLIIFLATACTGIEEIKASRIVDVGKRRAQLQKKVGLGLNIDEFNQLANEGRIRHVGLPESAAMIASMFGIKSKKIKEIIKPVVSEGKVIGIKQKVSIKKDGKRFITLSLQMSLGAKQKDTILIRGKPPINLVIKEGIQGDMATPAIVVNLIGRVLACKEKGLISMKGLAIGLL